ncbi:MAG: hypothetical protein KKF27_22075 [Gammaproteobacteria bacterium]|nr:hypothetical protein [Gammaproteobacteria bacterium]
MRIYLAGKWEERDGIRKLMDRIEELGHVITCDWTRHEHTDPVQCALLDMDAVSSCHVLILYAVNDYSYKGALCEVGAALALHKEVFVIGNALDSCIFFNHPLVKKGWPKIMEGKI